MEKLTAQADQRPVEKRCFAVSFGFVRWTSSELPSFRDEKVSTRFYKEFRNGLVHECRVKNGGKFALVSEPDTLRVLKGVLAVNVRCLIQEIDQALRKYKESLRQSSNLRTKLSNLLLKEFEYEFRSTGRRQAKATTEVVEVGQS